MTIADDIRTVVARRVLLDALQARRAHRPALVVVGAQAVYLRTGSGDLAVAAYTFDGDLALDPTLLDDDPLLEQVMSDAGFSLMQRDGHDEPGTWVTSRRAGREEIWFPVDLIVPEAFAPRGGRRSVQVGAHSKLAPRRTHGKEVTDGAVGRPRRLQGRFVGRCGRRAGRCGCAGRSRRAGVRQHQRGHPVGGYTW